MTIKEYLDCEWKAKNPQTPSHVMMSMFDTTVKVPLQQNYYDCGIFVLQYVQQFLSKPIKIFNMPIDLSKWFEQKVIETKRLEIRKLILDLSKQMPKNNNVKSIETKQADEKPAKTIAINDKQVVSNNENEMVDSNLNEILECKPETKKSKLNNETCIDGLKPSSSTSSFSSSKKLKNLNEDEEIQIDENINFDETSPNNRPKRKQTKPLTTNHKLPIKPASASSSSSNFKPQCEILFDQLIKNDNNNNNNSNDNNQNGTNESVTYKPKSFYGSNETNKRSSNTNKTCEIMNSLDNLN